MFSAWAYSCYWWRGGAFFLARLSACAYVFFQARLGVCEVWTRLPGECPYFARLIGESFPSPAFRRCLNHHFCYLDHHFCFLIHHFCRLNRNCCCLNHHFGCSKSSQKFSVLHWGAHTLLRSIPAGDDLSRRVAVPYRWFRRKFSAGFHGMLLM